MHSEKIDIPGQLSRLPLFATIGDEAIAHIAAATREKRLARGEVLFQRGDIPRGFHVVVQGQIKLAVSSAQGNEKVVEIVGPQQSFGEAVMFMDRPYLVFAEALMDTLLLSIGKNAVFAGTAVNLPVRWVQDGVGEARLRRYCARPERKAALQRGGNL